MTNKEASIVIKKIKKGGHAGHHGGAWKVAYADFVTAMMAFFLLLWLLQATAQSQKEGIAEYFTPTIGVRDSAGIGFKGGKTSYDEGRKVEEKSPPGILVGRMPQGPTAQKQEQQAPVESTQDAYLFEKAEKSIKQAMEEDPNFRDFKDNVIVEQSPEGLKISMIDDDKLPMYEPGTAQLTQAGEKLLRKMADVIKAMPNRISITGHTEATNYSQSAMYSPWELTADRANAARRFLMLSDIGALRVAKVTGRADQELLDEKNPTSARNRRVTIVLLRNSYLKTLEEHAAAPQNLLTVPKANVISEKPVKAVTAKPVAQKAAAAKPAAKEAIPATKADSTNVSPFTDEFRMPESLRRKVNGNAGDAGEVDEDNISRTLLSVPKPTAPQTPATPAGQTAPAAKTATPQAASPDNGNGTQEAPSTFRMPDAVRNSLDNTPQKGNTAPAGNKTGESLDSLPSGLIDKDQ